MPRWAAALLAAGTLSTIAISVLPQVNERPFAVLTGIALIALGHSLRREQRSRGSMPARLGTVRLDPAGAP